MQINQRGRRKLFIGAIQRNEILLHIWTTAQCPYYADKMERFQQKLQLLHGSFYGRYARRPTIKFDPKT